MANKKSYSKRIAIIQPNYIPWVGYFEMIKSVDEFIILDDVQYTKRDWRNRNYLNDNGKKILISLPVITKGRFDQKINKVEIFDKNWINDHLKKISFCYCKAPFFKEIFKFLEFNLNKNSCNNFSKTIYLLIVELTKFLNIKTKILLSSNIKAPGMKNDKLINICKNRKANEYVTGPLALNYLNAQKFSDEGIVVLVAKYKRQKNYLEQKKSLFLEKMSIIDLMFNQGKNSFKFVQDIDMKKLKI